MTSELAARKEQPANRDFPFIVVFGGTEPIVCETHSEVVAAVFETWGSCRVYRVEDDVPPRDITADIFGDMWAQHGPQGTYPEAFIPLMDRDQYSLWAQAHGRE